MAERDPVRDVERYAQTRDAMRQAVEHHPPIARRKQEGGVWRRLSGRGSNARTDGLRPEPQLFPELPFVSAPPPPEPDPTRDAMTYDEAVEHNLRVLDNGINKPRRT